jgi:hypothetical protein
VESGKRQKKQQESKEATHKRAELYHMEHGKLLKSLIGIHITVENLPI